MPKMSSRWQFRSIRKVHFTTGWHCIKKETKALAPTAGDCSWQWLPGYQRRLLVAWTARARCAIQLPLVEIDDLNSLCVRMEGKACLLTRAAVFPPSPVVLRHVLQSSCVRMQKKKVIFHIFLAPKPKLGILAPYTGTCSYKACLQVWLSWLNHHEARFKEMNLVFLLLQLLNVFLCDTDVSCHCP